jgi:hypothetical protein
MNNHFTRTTPSVCKASLLLTIVQGPLAKCVANTQVIANILFTDGTGFRRDGIVKFHNTHLWVDDNHHTTVTSRRQHRFSMNIYVGIWGDQNLGSIVLTDTQEWCIIGFLANYLPVLLEHVPLHQRQHTRSMFNGASADFLRPVRHYLNQSSGELRIGRGGPINCPARSLTLSSGFPASDKPEDFRVFGNDQWLKVIK